MPDSSTADKTGIIVPQEVFDIAAESIGKFFEPICRSDRKTIVTDFLDPYKAYKRAAILQKYTTLQSKKVLEVGSGFGTNLAVWIKDFGADAYGSEPGGEGFDQGYVASRILLKANGIDSNRVVNSQGESLPFEDESFDLVYSANVLEHTENPEQVLSESLRVLRTGGLLQMEMPNYLSYFEGHYMVVMPPIIWKPMLGWWVKFLFGRDPAFARSLQTRVNPIWCRRTVAQLSRKYPSQLLSLGESEFLERLANPFRFDTQVVAGRLQRTIDMVTKINRANWVGRLIVALQGHYPIYLTVKKRQKADVESN